MSPPQQNDHLNQITISMEESVKQILNYLGEDNSRPGLVDTPRRVTRAWQDFLSGYFHKIQAIDMVKSALFSINDESEIHDEKRNGFCSVNEVNLQNGSSNLRENLSQRVGEIDVKHKIIDSDFSSNSSQNSISNTIDRTQFQSSLNGDFQANIKESNGNFLAQNSASQFISNQDVQNHSNGSNMDKQLIVVKDVEFVSISSEDLWPVLGKCHVGYVPGDSGLVVGLSKIARICRCLSQRLTNQQQLLQQLISTIQHGLNPYGVAVLIEMQYLNLGGSISTQFMVSYQGCFSNCSDERFFEDFVTAMALHGIDTDLAVQIPYQNQHGHGHSSNFLSQIKVEEFPDQSVQDSSDDDSSESAKLSTIDEKNGTNSQNIYGGDIEILLNLSQAIQNMLQTCIRENSNIPQNACIRYADRLLRQCTYSSHVENSRDFSVVKLKQTEKFLGVQGFVCQFSSVCEHHILPFYGKFWIVTRKAKNFTIESCKELIGKFSCRLQMQERLTQQICEGVGECEGVMVVCEAYHMCMLARGVQSRKSNTVTVMSRGCFDSDFDLRRKILMLIRRDQTEF